MAEADALTIEVEVVYALPGEQIVQTLHVPADATVQDAIELAGIRRRYPEISSGAALGIFGRRVEISAALRQFDRIEIYRPLIVDPKQARRSRARSKSKRSV